MGDGLPFVVDPHPEGFRARPVRLVPGVPCCLDGVPQLQRPGLADAPGFTDGREAGGRAGGDVDQVNGLAVGRLLYARGGELGEEPAEEPFLGGGLQPAGGYAVPGAARRRG